MKNLFVAVCLVLVALQSCTTEEKNQPTAKKAIFVILDGIPDDVLDTVPTPNLDKIIAEGGITKAMMGGEKDGYSQTPTISAVGYNTVLTGVWANKHNVWGNSIKDPNYHYPTLFRVLKNNNPEKKNAIYSTWLDNRTKLVGDGLPQTGNLTVDYHFDGLEIDTVSYPHDEERTYIHLIDEEVSKKAAEEILEKSPDLTWMYLEFTDDMSHKFGNSPQFVDAIQKADIQVGRVWDAIKKRESKYNEDWLIVITTDHGREDSGYGHGGQSERERSVWIATNYPETNAHFNEVGATVDIFPSIVNFLDLEIPKEHAMELDGVPFIGQVDVSNFKAVEKGEQIHLTWNSLSKTGTGKVWISTTNHFKMGGTDDYQSIGEVNLSDEKFTFSPENSDSEYYKIVLETPSGYLNYWITEE
ncbi:alkaline phosphatase family protein [Algoriphagus lutimaris]|uniref:alkaline phosphatase family protein n=1 Tax=Algoriphagus lutimaris TaxID=613197 RepID=UPI00196B06BF|nr:alkaline phosphatase family protein [Algoriphagus lutimaris]MBN3521185.1 alkaline phosphatase family protein [Algoriphagus lutimaris]